MSINKQDLKLNHYYLQSNEFGLLALREMPEAEFENASIASRNIHDYHYHKRRLREVELNLDNFFERFNHYQSKAITESYAEKHEFFDLVYVDLNKGSNQFSEFV